MSIEKPENNANDKANWLGYKLFREGAIRRFNPCLFAVKRENNEGWFLVELKDDISIDYARRASCSARALTSRRPCFCVTRVNLEVHI